MQVALMISLLFLFVGILEIIMGIPLYLEKIKPNQLYGFRVKKTLSNKDIWYKSNKYTGKDLIIAGFVVGIGSFIVLLFIEEFNIVEISLFGLILLLGPLTIVVIRALNYIQNL